MTPFRNEPIVDFARDESARRAQAAAIEGFKAVEAPLVVDGRRLPLRDAIESTSPIDPKILVGRAGKATAAQARKAVEAAHAAFGRWSAVPPEERAEILVRAAAGMRARRWELNATMILEVGKTWTEADADTAEAIDFCEYYAREGLRYAQDPPVTPVPGERNRLRYVPMGAVVSISPWNFPCAILTGMAAGPLAAGNPVIMKPASVSPIIAWKSFEILEEAGVPPGVLQYLPCSGGEVGDLLVDHPLVRVVSFTGSKEIGTRIHERASRVGKGQRWLKRTVIEMGGKDAIVVDADADLEAAAAGIVASAFGFQGQKCSACSRAIVVGKAYRPVLDRVVALTRALRVGDPRDPATQVGPVVDGRQLKKVSDYIRIGRREGKLVAGGRRLDGPGYLLEPTIFADVDPRARISQEEIFGPVLAFTRAKDFDDALRIANDTDYGLTGAYYGTRTAEAAERFHVGNLYLNRKCTGALVGGHPFGGFKMSGTNSKAGGPDYLRLFLEAKAIAEKV
ncbi:MAG TPA: L-glutamate gamma-semialdehyde dehydrogenase [Planctomycetota bacterium]|nr:L-glutamate gamma-semialdehyde dehydrogenase [Planctomycetota bacterium]